MKSVKTSNMSKQNKWSEVQTVPITLTLHTTIMQKCYKKGNKMAQLCQMYMYMYSARLYDPFDHTLH